MQLSLTVLLSLSKQAMLVLQLLTCPELLESHLGGAELAELDLGGAELAELDLGGAELVELDLGGAELVELDPGGAELVELDPGGAELVELIRPELADVDVAIPDSPTLWSSSCWKLIVGRGSQPSLVHM